MASLARITLSGRVQGVGCRSFVSSLARSSRLSGWVKNRADGRVEMVAEGGKKEIEKFIEKLEDAPPPIRVDGKEVEWGEPEGFEGFSIVF